MSPYTCGILILVVLVACAEVNSFRRAHSVRRYEQDVKSRKA